MANDDDQPDEIAAQKRNEKKAVLKEGQLLPSEREVRRLHAQRNPLLRTLKRGHVDLT